MPIVIYMGRNVNEYGEISEKVIEQKIKESKILCELCTKLMKIHSHYQRRIKETGEKIKVTIVWCKDCKRWHALLPDFLLAYKQYSGNEIENVIIESQENPVSQINTEASESTVRRWIKQIGEKIKGAVGILRYIFKQAICDTGENEGEQMHVYTELEHMLVKEPKAVEHSGNRLGHANIWLGTYVRNNYI